MKNSEISLEKILSDFSNLSVTKLVQLAEQNSSKQYRQKLFDFVIKHFDKIVTTPSSSLYNSLTRQIFDQIVKRASSNRNNRPTEQKERDIVQIPEDVLRLARAFPEQHSELYERLKDTSRLWYNRKTPPGPVLPGNEELGVGNGKDPEAEIYHIR